MKVAVGYALLNEPGPRYHLGGIPAGYAIVGVDDIVTGFETMELDHPGGEDEKTLLDVKRSFALWNKKYIIFPGPLPRPPTPPCSSPPQQKVHTYPRGTPARVHLDLRRVREG